MNRRFVAAAVLALFTCTSAFAANVTGTLVKVDAGANTITVKDKDGKETAYDLAKDVKLPKHRSKKTGTEKEVTLKALAKVADKGKDKGKAGGLGVKLTTDKKDGKEVVTEIQIARHGKKAGKVKK